MKLISSGNDIPITPPIIEDIILNRNSSFSPILLTTTITMSRVFSNISKKRIKRDTI